MRTMYTTVHGTPFALRTQWSDVQSNLSTVNHLRTTENVHYIRVFTTSGCSLHQGDHYIRVITTSG